MIVFQIWTTVDPAQTDTFVPTLRHVKLHLEEFYGILETVKLDEKGKATFYIPDDVVHVQRHVINSNKYDVCAALSDLPQR